MRYLVAKDRRHRHGFARTELDQLIFKTLSRSYLGANKIIRRYINSYYYGLNSLNRRTQIRNRCLVTGRASSVIRPFKLSRLQLKDFFSKGYLFGFRRSSW